MGTKYEWIDAGGSLPLPANGVPTEFTCTPIFGTTLRRVVLHRTRLQGFNSAVSSSVVEPLSVHMEVKVGTPFGDVRPRYATTRAVPMAVTGFFADAIDVYNVWWNAGDLELGFNQELQVKPVFGFPQQVNLTLAFLNPAGTFNYEAHVSMDLTFSALYSYLG